ncbi:hypothetical protein KCU95_g18391, partial [Aureobasidium melanogenum]
EEDDSEEDDSEEDDSEEDDSEEDDSEEDDSEEDDSEEDDDSQSHDHGALAKTPRQSSRRLPTPPTTPATSKSPKKGKPQATLHTSIANWHTTWSTILEPHVNTSWAIGLNDVITRMFTYDGIDDLARLLQDLHRTKDAIAVDNANQGQG